MDTYRSRMFTEEELNKIRGQFYYVDEDHYGRKRLFFDNAGGSLRLKKAEEVFHLIDSFYPLREDYDRLRYASYMLQILEAQAIPGDRADKLFQLLIRSLKRLCYLPLEPRAVTAAFLLMDAALSGYRPRLSHCVRCGKRLAETEARLFDIEEGGLVCDDCASRLIPAVPVNTREIIWMKDILQNGIEKTERPP